MKSLSPLPFSPQPGVHLRDVDYIRAGFGEPYDWAMQELHALLKPDVAGGIHHAEAADMFCSLREQGMPDVDALRQAAATINAQYSRGQAVSFRYRPDEARGLRDQGDREFADLPDGFGAFRLYPGAKEISEEEWGVLVTHAVTDQARGFRLVGQSPLNGLDFDLEQLGGAQWRVTQRT